MLRDPHEAEDAAQQTFLSAYTALLAGTVPRDPPAWLATIARNECRTRIQQQMRRPLPVAEAYSATSDAADEAARAAEVESLRRALAELPGRQRSAFVLREFSGLSYDELAVALGVTAPAVESLLFRARQRVRESLRAAAAAAASVPAGIRDLLGQLSATPSDSTATVAKLGSAPLLAKLASVGAGAAFLTTGATGVLPAAHHRGATAHPKGEVAAEPRGRPLTGATAVSERPEQEIEHAHRRGEVAEHRAIEQDRGPGSSSGGDRREMEGQVSSGPVSSSEPTEIVATKTVRSDGGDHLSGGGSGGELGESSGSGSGSNDLSGDGSGSGTH
jgi:RNA polymerase sigma-70 factor (ECF subfamily)